MLVLPSVDIRQGRCVRLIQGARDRELVYGDDPIAAAQRWEAEGAPWLHVVDLDGAFQGRPVNEDTIAGLVRAVRLPVQVGGGIRDAAAVARYLVGGAARVVLGTAAATSPDFLRDVCAQFGDRVAVGIDARGGSVVTDGWVTATGERAVDAAVRVIEAGARRLIFTDTSRDGMLGGPNLRELEALLEVAAAPVIASGGVASAADVRGLRALEARGLEGVIVGRALYEGRVRLQDLLAAAA